MEGQELLSFRFRGGGKKGVVSYCISGRDFLSQSTAIVVDIKKYPSAKMSCCSNDLAQLLPCLDL